MQKLNTLWQAASTVQNIAQHTRSYHFQVDNPTTFYLRTEQAEVVIMRWAQSTIEVKTYLQGAFGWRVATDQDEAGVYMAASRRPVVGGLSSARFEVQVPHTAYLVLKLVDSTLTLKNVDGTVQLSDGNIVLDTV